MQRQFIFRGYLLPPEQIQRDLIAILHAHAAGPETLLIGFDHKNRRHAATGVINAYDALVTCVQ